MSGTAASVGNAAASATGNLVMGLLFGTFNPNYKKDDRRRMRYIQLKYAQAYGGEGDPNSVINDMDSNSKLKMTSDGAKPANPFSDEQSFEEALVVNFHPRSGHQGQFSASHALTSIGVIVEYQNQRRQRLWIPGVSSPGKPNDYINMFLEEMKSWMREQMTLDTIAAEELRKRHVYITKLKNDKYFWCFPPESANDARIHAVIDTVHARVVNALEIREREEANKSMAQLFKELNDHSTNVFEFGKAFLVFLLYVTKLAPNDLVNSNKGRTIEEGRLQRILEKATDPVMKSYVQEMKTFNKHMNVDGSMAIQDVAMPGNDKLVGQSQSDTVKVVAGAFKVESVTFESGTISATTFSITLFDRGGADGEGTRWLVKKPYSDFVALHKILEPDFDANDVPLSTFPPPFSALKIASTSDYDERCALMKKYVQAAIWGCVDDASLAVQSKKALAEFINVKSLPDSCEKKVVHAENIPNHFMDMRKKFVSFLAGSISMSEHDHCPGVYNLERELADCREMWGHEGVLSILAAYAHLQRIATIIGWTLEINHFFVSMFGNTLAFCKLPIRELLLTQKDAMLAFQRTANGLYSYACKLNTDKNYKWHKNLEVTEATLKRCRFHIDRAVTTIQRLEVDHLDRETQLRRLKDVAARFEPFMRRIDGSLPQIQSELGLPIHVLPPALDEDVNIIMEGETDFKFPAIADSEPRFDDLVPIEDGDESEEEVDYVAVNKTFRPHEHGEEKGFGESKDTSMCDKNNVGTESQVCIIA